MRTRENRVERALRGVILSVLAAPAAATTACGSSGAATTADASLGGPADDAAAAPGASDATVEHSEGGADAGATADAGLDATTGGADGAACEEVAIVDASYDDSPDGCSTFHLLPCGLPPDATVQACYVDLLTCASLCGTQPFLTCALVFCGEAGPQADAATILDCASCNGIAGRRPLGLREPARRPRRATAGGHFAEMARLESASVRAFADLERWLTAHRAPLRLRRAVRRAAADERRHARAMRRVARRFGGEPSRPHVREVPLPSLATLLIDDAVEGCVGETFGALVALWQAEHADDARVRRTLGRIASDEIRHAALAWEILAWGAPRVPAHERGRVLAALERALRSSPIAAVLPDAAERRICGQPDPETFHRLRSALARVVRAEAERLVMRRRPEGEPAVA